MTDLEFVNQIVDQYEDKLIEINDKIWNYAELPYEESKSAALLCSVLKEEGFEVTEGAAEIPTAFMAVYQAGTGQPVVGILGEFDALDTLSQKAGCTVKEPVREGAPGHGCGHCCLGAGALGAAIALKEYLIAEDMSGTIIYYGCAAEEGAGAKQFMARAGLFDGVDFVYTWHPATRNEVSPDCNVAIMGANFEFHGLTSHAGGSPHLGRSALDAAELMSVGVNYLREHMIDKARIHYAYVDAGGTAPNVVQDHSLVKYEVRAPKVSQMKELFDRVADVARGAALMTGTTMTYQITMAFSDYVPNDVLAETASRCLMEIGAPKWSDADYELARRFLESYNDTTKSAIWADLTAEFGAEQAEDLLRRPLHSEVTPYPSPEQSKGGFPPHRILHNYVSGSTDVGDVGYAVPTLNLHVATACLGNVGHTWQMTAQAGSVLGHKGLLTAAKAIALASIRTMKAPEIMTAAKQEYVAKTGGVYCCPLPNEVKPPIGIY